MTKTWNELKCGGGHRVCDMCGKTVFGTVVHICRVEDRLLFAEMGRAHYKAEAERLQKELDDVKPFVCSMVNKCPDDELKAMTALAKKYKGQRDELITLWKSRDGSINNMLALIKRIQEVDGDMPKM